VRLLSIAVLLLSALLLAACEPANGERTPEPGEPGAIPETGGDLDQRPPVDGEAVVQISENALHGAILVDQRWNDAI
jgi:hypothetical protein